MSRKTKALEFIDAEYPVTVTGRNLHVTDPMKEYAVEKLSKIDKFENRIIDASVIMDIQKLDHRVDITVKLDHILIKGHGSSTDMYASIDKAVNRIQTQLRRYKGKIRDHQAKGVKAIDMSVNVLRVPADEEFFEFEEQAGGAEGVIDQYKPHEVVGKETLPLKKLNLDEAVMKMELSGDAFLVYLSEEDKKLKVIYRRKDGNYGIINPEF